MVQVKKLTRKEVKEVEVETSGLSFIFEDEDEVRMIHAVLNFVASASRAGDIARVQCGISATKLLSFLIHLHEAVAYETNQKYCFE